MLRTKAALLFALLAPQAFAQLTADQRVADFMQLAGLYAKNYAAYEWKRDVFGFDLYDVKPWLDQVKAAKDDLEFYDICVRYVAGLRDTHDEFMLPSDFMAALPVSVDIYDGKVLIDQINRTMLPAANFPFKPGDELVSLDGRKAADLIQDFLPFAADGAGNDSTRRRLAASTITARYQDRLPHAAQVGDTATVVVRDAGGAEASYVLPWIKSGTPFLHSGPVSSPKSAVKSRRADTEMEGARRGNRWGAWTGERPARAVDAAPEYLRGLRRLQISGSLGRQDSTGFNSFVPAFDEPQDFQLRLGAGQYDEFISGTFPVNGRKIGFLRIPSMTPYNYSAAMRQFAAEAAYFQANTDALVLDLMGNGGGYTCYAEDLAGYLFTRPFRGTNARIRATQEWVQEFSQDLYAAVAANAPKAVIDQYTSYVAQLQLAMNQDRGMTPPLPLCGPAGDVQPATDKSGNPVGYSKPILVLVDDFTVSSAENMAMFLQQEGRATAMGMRTAGGGGTPELFRAGTYGEGITRISRSEVVRLKPVSTPGFPATDYVENVGVYPEIAADYMTRENLLNGGAQFIQAFSDAVGRMLPAR